MTDAPQIPPQRREPLFNAPWTVLALIGLLVGAHALRLVLRLPPDPFAFAGDELSKGHWLGLLSYQLVHASWPHVLMNSAAVLAFGPPTARLFGAGPRGAGAFFAFFLVCGVIAALGYTALNSHDGLVGASGAASGLMGAAARLIDGHGRVGRLTGPTVIGMTAAWIIVNALLGLSGLTPGSAGLPVAWQAHIIGYFAGLLLIGAFARAAGASGDHAIAP
ncbi:MAG TPA: rhomboid family intramembrane serine protease [Caulobacteraceae bacterium]|jgi:membrane associated rhomboid family serine protease|nr:rhomboid family intramembrane serine protease [Caulobacteraceae bacterium]